MTKHHLVYLTVFALLVFTVTGSPVKNYWDSVPRGCPCITATKEDPVCGNNGVTYPNFMTLQCVDQCVNYNINQIHHGPCRT